MKKHIAFLAVAILLSSCASYHFGTTSPYLSSTYIDSIVNKTEEPQVGAMMHKALAEQLGTTPAKTKRINTCDLDVVIVDLANRSSARAETRDKNVRDKKSDAYQTVLYQITITVKYTLSNKQGLLRSGTVTGIGNLPKMHDRNVPLQNAIRLATNDAAKKIIADIADME